MANFFNLKLNAQTDFKLPFASETAGLQADVYTATPITESGVVSVITDLRFSGNDLTDYLKSSVPFCLLKEYELLTNSSINSLLYVLQGSGYTAAGISQLATTAVNNLPQGIASAATTVGTSIAEGATTLGIDDFISQGASLLKQSADNIVKLITKTEQLPGSLKPYQSLYIRQPTGFKYILPYFKNVKKSIQNSFSTTDQGLLAGNWVGNATKKLSEKVDEFVKTALFTAPGAYIEQPKFFNIGEAGPSYEVTFHLINTFDTTDIQKHYDFLFLLAFQNLPYRKDLARLRLPSIYSFTLPGEIFLPFAYISRMDVNFLGNRRFVKLNHPFEGKTTAAVVPDAYEVTLTITGLNPDMGNFMVNDYLINIQSTLAVDSPQYTAQPATIVNTPGTPAPLINPITPTPSVIPSLPSLPAASLLS